MTNNRLNLKILEIWNKNTSMIFGTMNQNMWLKVKACKWPKDWRFAITIGWTFPQKISCCFSVLSKQIQDISKVWRFICQTSEKKSWNNRKSLVLGVYGSNTANRMKKIKANNGKNLGSSFYKTEMMKSMRSMKRNWEIIKNKDLNTFTRWLSVIPREQLTKFINNVMETSSKTPICPLI
jgi:hypothetical protein